MWSKPTEWFRELDPISDQFVNDNEEIRNSLLEKGILQPSTNGELKFNFVGIVVYRHRTMAVLPKVKVEISNEEFHRQVIRTLKKYSKWVPSRHEPSPFLQNDPDRGYVSGIAATDWLVNDFLSHGLYRRSEEDFEINGSGRVSWTKTIGTLTPIFSKRRPIYNRVTTHRPVSNPSNFVTMLHLHLLEVLSAEFGPLFDYEPISLEHEAVDRFELLPSVEECERQIIGEMLVTYSDRNLELLKVLLATVKAIEIERSNDLAIYGTCSFHQVWEAVCGSVLGNSVSEWVPQLPRPNWMAVGGANKSSETFRPDIVVSLGTETTQLLIADAKYYRPNMPPLLDGVPGVNDVAKQIWYKQYLVESATRRGYKTIHNVFLFPSTGDLFTTIGHVEFPVGQERVQAVNVDFVKAMKAYSDGHSRSQVDSRLQLRDSLAPSSEHY